MKDSHPSHPCRLGGGFQVFIGEGFMAQPGSASTAQELPEEKEEAAGRGALPKRETLVLFINHPFLEIN